MKLTRATASPLGAAGCWERAAASATRLVNMSTSGMVRHDTAGSPNTARNAAPIAAGSYSTPTVALGSARTGSVLLVITLSLDWRATGSRSPWFTLSAMHRLLGGHGMAPSVKRDVVVREAVIADRGLLRPGGLPLPALRLAAQQRHVLRHDLHGRSLAAIAGV